MAYSGDAYKVLETSPLSASVQNAMIDNIYQSLNTLDTGKASSTHSHAQSEITGLVDALAGKASTSVATTSANGLMSSTDKTKLDGVPSPAAAQAGLVLGVDSSGSYTLVEVYTPVETSTTWGAM